MKKTLLTLTIALFGYGSYAQTNTFPSSGNAGIGTTSPLSTFSVGGAGNSRAAIYGLANGTASVYDIGGNFIGTSYGVVATSTSGIAVYGEATTGNGGYFTSSSGYGLIVANGNVGIGTTSPGAKLDVSGNVNTSGYFLSSATTSNTPFASQNFYGSAGYWGFRTATNNSYNLDTYNGGSPINAMTVLQGGNVGIGTTSPLQRFTIKSPGTNTGGSSTDYDFGITDGATNQMQLLGLVNTSGQYGLLQVIQGGVGPGNLVMQTQGGSVGIGTTSIPSAYKLAVNGAAIATSMTVKLYADWPDYVFKPTYYLPSLNTVKAYIDKNMRLPDMPSEQEVKDNGINLGEIVKVQTKKIEELTLYLIDKDVKEKEQDKKITQQEERLKKLESRLNALITEHKNDKN